MFSPRSSVSQKQSKPAHLIDLPYDLIRILCTLMPATDLVHMFLSCKNLYSLMSDEAMWKTYCLQYGLTRTDDLGGGSFFNVYSELLHTYGPLLGLWASDNPFRGRIIEFRIDARRRAIVGEAWHLNSGRRSLASSFAQAEYVPFLLIRRSGSKAVLNWDVDSSTPLGEQLSARRSRDTAHSSSLQVFPETYNSTYISHGSTDWLHPDFPASGSAPWYDHSRGLPRLTPRESPRAFISEAARKFRRFIASQWIGQCLHYVAQGTALKPPALCIVSADGKSQPAALVNNARRVFDLRPYCRQLSGKDREPLSRFYNRFYPLNFEARSGQSPTEPSWHPVSLEGLWFGDYGTHGTEVLYLSYDGSLRVICAWKVTGDENVPRGTWSWKINFDIMTTQADRIVSRWGEFTHDAESRTYHGSGHISERLFPRGETIDVVALVAGPDDILIHWSGMGSNADICAYKRCKPREYAFELEVSECVRQAGHSGSLNHVE